MLLAKIQKDLFDFTEQEAPEDFGPLLNFWYQANTPALSAALSAQTGLKLIVDVPNIRSLEQMIEKLFLLTDTIVLRGFSPVRTDDLEPTQLTPLNGYRPKHLEETIDQLKKLRPSPLTLLPPTPYWSSTTKTLKSGANAAYAMTMGGGTPNEIVQWINGSAKPLIESGRVVYAPFIPTLEMEHEFMRRNVDISSYFGASPCFHHSTDWLTKQQLDTLFALQIPFLKDIDLNTLTRIKTDNQSDFESFSRVILEAINSVKSSIDTDNFSSEIRHVQRHLIDAGISDVNKTFKKISNLSSLRKKGVALGLLGLNAAVYAGAPDLLLASGLTAAAVKMVTDKMEELKEQHDLREFKYYFLWKLGQEIKQHQ